MGNKIVKFCPHTNLVVRFVGGCPGQRTYPVLTEETNFGRTPNRLSDAFDKCMHMNLLSCNWKWKGANASACSTWYVLL